MYLMNKRQDEGCCESCGAFQRVEKNYNRETQIMGWNQELQANLDCKTWVHTIFFPDKSNTENIRLKLKLHKNYKKEL